MPDAPAAEHQAAQATLAGLLERDVARAWQQTLDTARLHDTLPRLTEAVGSLVHRYGTASAAVAAEFYDQRRQDAGARGTFTVIPADPPGLGQVGAGVKWATRNLWSAEPDTKAARTMTEGVASRLMLNTSRDTILDSVLADRAARGWARVPEPGACAFCAMLATRGAAYKTDRTAEFHAHDGDRCHVEPVFTAYEPSAQVREWQALWRKSTAGKSGAAAVAAFRDALGHN